MGRINVNDLDAYDNQSSSNSEWLKLQNHGDVARVQFLYDSYEDLDTYACHKVVTGFTDSGKEIERWVDCKRNYDDPIDTCPFCAAGIPVKPVNIIRMYDHADGKVKLWERGKVFRKQLEALFNRYPKLSDMVFEIERNGQKGDQKTTYQLFPMPDVEPVDVSNIEKQEFVGTVILDKSVDEMNYYNEHKCFPNNNSNEQQSQPRVSRRESAPQPRGGVTRRASVQ